MDLMEIENNGPLFLFYTGFLDIIAIWITNDTIVMLRIFGFKEIWIFGFSYRELKCKRALYFKL